jgi:hypothetical protein
MATEGGGYLRSVFAVSPMKCGKYPRDNAVSSVDRAGENKVACANATSSEGVAEWTAEKL